LNQTRFTHSGMVNGTGMLYYNIDFSWSTNGAKTYLNSECNSSNSWIRLKYHGIGYNDGN